MLERMMLGSKIQEFGSEIEDMLSSEISIDRLYTKEMQTLLASSKNQMLLDDIVITLFTNYANPFGSEDIDLGNNLTLFAKKAIYTAYQKFLFTNEYESTHQMLKGVSSAIQHKVPQKAVKDILEFEIHRAHAMGYFKEFKYAYAIKHLNPAVASCPMIGELFSSGLSDALVLLSESYSALGKRDDALHSARLAVNIAHERLERFNKDPMFATTYKDLLNFESPMLDSFTSLILAYCSLASELEKSGMGHLCIDWYQRAYQAAVKFRLDKKVLQELQKLLDLSHAHRVPSQPPTASNSQRVSTMSPYKQVQDNGNWHVKESSSGKEHSNPSNPVVVGAHDSMNNGKTRPKSALPRLFQDRTGEDADSTTIYETKRNENERRRPSNEAAKSQQSDNIDMDDLSRPKSAVSKLGERYNNMVNSSNADTERLINKMLTSTSAAALQRVPVQRDGFYPPNPATYSSGDLLTNKRMISAVSTPTIMTASLQPFGHSIILLPTPSMKNKSETSNPHDPLSQSLKKAPSNDQKPTHTNSQQKASASTNNTEVPQTSEKSTSKNPLSGSALKKSALNPVPSKGPVPLTKANKTALSKTIQTKVLEKIKTQKEENEASQGKPSSSSGPVIPEAYLHLDEFGREKIKRVADMYIPYFKGLKVEARYQMNRLGHKGRWYPGRIINADFARGLYDIEFENGDREKNIFVDNIRIPEHASKQALAKSSQSIKTLPRKREDDEYEKKLSGKSEERIPARVLRNKNGEEMHNVVMKLLGSINQRNDIRKMERIQVKAKSTTKIQALIRGVLCRIRFPKRIQQLKREKDLRNKEKELKALEDKLLKGLQSTDSIPPSNKVNKINDKSADNGKSKSFVTFAEVQTGSSLAEDVEVEARDVEKEQSFNYMINENSHNFLGADLNMTYPDERVQFPISEETQGAYVLPPGANIAYYQPIGGESQQLFAPMLNNYVVPNPNLEYVQEILAATVQEQQRGWKEMEQERANYFAQEVNELREAFLSQRNELERLKREEERKRHQLEKQIKSLLEQQQQQSTAAKQADVLRHQPKSSALTQDSPNESVGQQKQVQPPQSIEKKVPPPSHKPQEAEKPTKFSPRTEVASTINEKQFPVPGSDNVHASSSIDCEFLNDEEGVNIDQNQSQVNRNSEPVELSVHFDSSQENQELGPVSAGNSMGQDVRIEDFWNSLSLGDFPASERPGTVSSPNRQDPERINVLQSPLPMNPDFFGSAILGESLVEKTSMELGGEFAAVVDGSLSIADEELDNLASQVDLIEKDMNSSRHDMAYRAMLSMTENGVDVDLDEVNNVGELQSSLISKKNEDSISASKKQEEQSNTIGSNNNSNVIGFSGEVPPPHIERYMSFHGLGDVSVSNNEESNAEDAGDKDDVEQINSVGKLSTSDFMDTSFKQQQILTTSFDSQQHQFAMDVVQAFMEQVSFNFSPAGRQSSAAASKVVPEEKSLLSIQEGSQVSQGNKSTHSIEEIKETKEIAQVVAEEAISAVDSILSANNSTADNNDHSRPENLSTASPRTTSAPQLLDTSQESKLSIAVEDNKHVQGTTELTKEEREEMIIEWMDTLWNSLLDWTVQQIFTYIALTIAAEKSIVGIRSSSTLLPESEPLKQEFSSMLKDLAFECDDEDDGIGEDSEVMEGGGSINKGNMSPQTLRINSFLSEKVVNNNGNDDSKWIDQFVEQLQHGRILFEEANRSIDGTLILGRDELDENDKAMKLIFEDMISTLQELATNFYQFYVSNILLGSLPSKDVIVEYKPSDVNPYLVSALQSNWNSKWWLDIDRRLVSFFACFKSDIAMHTQRVKGIVKGKYYDGLRNVLKRCEGHTWLPYWQSRENCQLLIGKETLGHILAKSETIMYVVPVTSPTRPGKDTLVTPVKTTPKLAFDATPVIELIKKVASSKR